jgi:hypothetical protein
MTIHYPAMLGFIKYLQTYLKRIKNAKKTGNILWKEWKDGTFPIWHSIIDQSDHVMSHHNDTYDDQNDGDGKTISGFIQIGFSDLNPSKFMMVTMTKVLEWCALTLNYTYFNFKILCDCVSKWPLLSVESTNE